jgi:hypothetical protein
MGYIPHSVLHQVEERIGNRGLLKSPKASRGGLLASQSHGPTTSCRRCVVCQMPHSHSVGPWFGIRCMVVWYAAVSIGGSGGVRAFGIDKAARSQQEVQEQQAASERHNTSSSEPTSRTGALIDRIPCRPTAQRNSNASRATPVDIYRRQRATAGHAPRHARHVTRPVCPQHTHLAVEYAHSRLCVSPGNNPHSSLHSGSVSLSWPRAHALSLVCGMWHASPPVESINVHLTFDVAYAPLPRLCPAISAVPVVLTLLTPLASGAELAVRGQPHCRYSCGVPLQYRRSHEAGGYICFWGRRAWHVTVHRTSTQ